MVRKLPTVALYLALLGVTLIIGIWHGLPNVNIVGDESVYVGGVLRAMQLHTLVPQIFNAYTLSFYVNYLLMLVPLTCIAAWFNFHTAPIVIFLYSHYALLYLVPRFTSVIASLVIAWTFLRMARLLRHTESNALVVTSLMLSTIILAVIMHTGKMWALSGMLLVLCDYFFLRTVLEDTVDSTSWYRSSLFWCIGCGFLGTTNFPFTVIALLCVPFLLYQFRTSRSIQLSIIAYSIFWGLVFTLFTLVNLHGWVTQNSATAIGAEPSAGFGSNLWYQLQLIVYLLPFLALALVIHVRKIAHKPFFYLTLLQCVLYILLLCIRAPWAADNLGMLRYSFFTVLLFGCMLMATFLSYRKVLLVLLLLSCIFYGKTLYLLAAPTTYNQAGDWIIANLGSQKIVVDNTILNLDLPENAHSYKLTIEGLCSSMCETGEKYHLDSSFQYIVVDPESSPLLYTRAKLSGYPQYLVTVTEATSSKDVLIASFGDNPSSSDYYSVGYSIGMYKPEYLLVPRLGPNIYVYKVE